MKTAEKILEIESLLENLIKKNREGSILRMKILFFSHLYQDLSISMIIEKLGIKKTNFALMSAALEKEGCLVIKKSNMDRRCRVIELTEKGRKELDNYLTEVGNNFGATPIEIEQNLDSLSRFLNKII
ncbi:MAG: winged helix-turn-helix transcriptional regulator [Clostridiales bacterium]|nr:winged helix-turn-helix transcriptional regulator [Clostridiales bacterium]